MGQIGIPVVVAQVEIARERSMGGALELCVKAAGLEPKEVQSDLKWDKGQWSRWMSGGEGITWPKFVALMDHCGNDAPLMWMLLARGYDIASLRRLESETERENRLLREENAALKRVLQGSI